jgi:hypothetical protein
MLLPLKGMAQKSAESGRFQSTAGARKAKTEEARSEAADHSRGPFGKRSLPFCDPRSFSFVFIGVHSRFKNLFPINL